MYRIVIYLFFLLSAAACGFQLRDAVELPANLQPLYVHDVDDVELARQLSLLLKEKNTVFAASAELATSSLKIISQKQDRRVLSVDSRGRALEYELHYSVLYQLKSKHMDAENVVKLRRVLLFDPDNVLGADNEEATLYREMQRDAAGLILQQLQATTRKTARPHAAAP